MKNKILKNFVTSIVLMSLFILGISTNSVQAVNTNKTVTNEKSSETSKNNTNISQKTNQTQNQIQNQTQKQQVVTSSSNANLSNLGIYTYDFTGFKPGIISYNTTVPNDVTQVSVYAVPQDGATYEVSGNTDLKVGTNQITITVTAADKITTKKYYIYVERESSTTSNGKEEKLALESIEIDEKYETDLEPEFKSNVYKYTIKLNGDIDKIPLNAVANNEKAKVKITGNENLKDGENTILIKVTYGTEEVEYKITVRKNMDQEVEQTQWDNSYSKYMSEEHVQYGWYILGTILLVFSIVAIILIIRKIKFK